MTGAKQGLVLGVLAVAALVAGVATPAHADRPSLTISPGGTLFRDGHPLGPSRRGQHVPHAQGVRPGAPRHDGRHGFPHGHHHFKHFRGHNVIVLPSPVVVVPGRCWTQGYWAYQWVPQAAPYQHWVAGHWSPAGTWVPGHYQTHYHQSGYYQPYWVEGYWSGC
jgi:hypothetical protein